MKRMIILLLLLASTLFCAKHAAAQAVHVGYSAKVLTYLPLFVAQERGFYAAEGLKAELHLMARTDQHLQALVAGELHFAVFNPDGVILFNEQGGNLKVVGGVANAAPYLLIGSKEVKKLDDLKGTKLGASALKGGTGSLIQAYLRAKGMSYPRDYALVVIAGGTPAFLSALEKGAVAAAALGIPFSDMALDQGLTNLGDITEVLPAYQFNAINVSPSWAEKNRATVAKLLKAHVRSIRWIYENPAEAADLTLKEMGIKQPYSRKGIDYFIKQKVFPMDGSVSMDGMKANIEVQARDELLKEPLPSPQKYVDLSYLKQALKDLGK